MDRRSFLKRLGLGTGALVVAPQLTLERLAESPAAETDYAVPPAVKGSLVASGGLCAPVNPCYALEVRPTLFPLLRGDRTGLRYVRPPLDAAARAR